jgi:hypothetical protein
MWDEFALQDIFPGQPMSRYPVVYCETLEEFMGVNRKRWQKSHRTPHICVRKFNLPQYIGVSNSKCGENHVKYTSTALNLFSLIEIAPVDQS